MLENPYYHNEDAKQERGFLRKVIAVLGAICFFLLFALAATWPTKAHALQLSHQECQGYAVWSHDVVLMRDVGANKEKVRAYLESKKSEIPYFARLLKEFDQLWQTKADRVEKGTAVYNDCVKRRGNYGFEV